MSIKLSQEPEEIKTNNGDDETLETRAISSELWDRIVSSNARLSNFFDITVKAASMRGKPIPATVIISPDDKIEARFLLELAQNMSTKDIKMVDAQAMEAPGDYIALLTNLSEGAIFCLSEYSDKFEKNKKIDALNLTKQATKFALDITIGKGPSANSLHLDLSEFSFVISVRKASDITKGLKECISNIINLSLPGDVEDEVRKHRIKGLLAKENFSISEETLNKITEFTFSDKYSIESCFITVRDYMIVKSRGSIIEIDDVNNAFRGTGAITKRLTAEELDSIDPYDFEEYVTNLFARMGYETEHTGQSGDQGIDVIAERDTIRIGIQAKCYSGPVGNGAVQEVLSGVRFYNLDKGFVVTNSYFTQSACELARASRVTLWDKDKLTELISKYSK